MSTLNAVVVTYKNRELLARCVETLLRSIDRAGVEGVVTVVDNGSGDGTRETVNGSYPTVNYIENPDNLGLARALNIGIGSVKETDYTLLLNDDIELFPDTVGVMVETLEEHPWASGIPASLIRPDGSLQRMKTTIAGLSGRRSASVRPIGFSGTTACMYRTGIFTRVGLFDEFYFFYNEDLDFAVRAKRMGVRFVFNPAAKVIHLKCQGRRKAERSVKPYFYATNYYFYRKNYGRAAAALSSAVSIVQAGFTRLALKRSRDADKLELLEQAWAKLLETMRRYGRLEGRHHV